MIEVNKSLDKTFEKAENFILWQLRYCLIWKRARMERGSSSSWRRRPVEFGRRSGFTGTKTILPLSLRRIRLWLASYISVYSTGVGNGVYSISRVEELGLPFRAKWSHLHFERAHLPCTSCGSTKIWIDFLFLTDELLVSYDHLPQDTSTTFNILHRDVYLWIVQ